MSAPMRGPWVRRRPHLLHLLHLLLLLLFSLTGTVRCEGEEEEEEVDDGAAADDVPAEEVPEESDPAETEVSEAEPRDGEETPNPPTEETITKDFEAGLGSGFNSTADPELTGTDDPLYSTPAPGDETLSLIIIPLLVALVAVVIGAIVCGIFISRRCKSNKRNQELRKEDPYLDGSSTEKVPMPMFEEDVPSVLELEMEELGQWMKKDGEIAEDSNHA